MRRVFLLKDKAGRNLDVEATLERYGGNQKAHFSLRCKGGSDQDLTFESAPAEVRDDLVFLAAMRGRDETGERLHAVANAAYHLDQGEFTKAQASLGEPAKLEDVIGILAARERLLNGSPNPVDVALENIAATATALVAEQDKVNLRRREQATFVSSERLFMAALRFSATKRLADPDSAGRMHQRLDGDQRTAGAKLVKADIVKEAKAIVEKGIPERERESIRERIREAATLSETGRLADTLRPTWLAEVEKAKAILSKPDYRAKGRLDADVDPQTYAGFAAINGIIVEIGKATSPGAEALGDGFVAYPCSIRTERSSTVIHYAFQMHGSRDKPTEAMILESLQSDASTAISYPDEDEFLNSMGFVGDLKAVRRGEKAFKGCKEIEAHLRDMMDDDAFREFMTSVGDAPPLDASWFEENSPTP